MQPSRDVFTLQPAPLDAPSHADRQSRGGLQVPQLLGTNHAFGTGSGSPVVGHLQRLSPTATGRPDGRIAEPAVKQPSPKSRKRHGYSVSCAVTGTSPPSGAESNWPGAADFQPARFVVSLTFKLTSRRYTMIAGSSSATTSGSLPMPLRPACRRLALLLVSAQSHRSK